MNVCQTIVAVNSVSCLQEQLIHLSESLVVNLLALPWDCEMMPFCRYCRVASISTFSYPFPAFEFALSIVPFPLVGS